jgi:nucleoside-diphosphate-sugar epimerase
MKYLVLGSAGLIGLALTKFLHEKGHSVATFDIADNINEDLRKPSTQLNEAVCACDFIFFLAWDVGGSRYLAKHQDTFDFIQNNLKIIVNTFDVINQYKKPFIFSSSQMANMSYSSYSLTKNIGEKVSNIIGGITVKFWNVYGIEHDPEKAHVVTDFINKARNTGVIDMRTDGTEQRQMLHADDCSECLYTLSRCYDELPRDKEYHISNFKWDTMLDVAEIIAKHYSGTIVRPGTGKDTIQKDKRNEPDPWILNYWQPRIDLKDGIANIIKEMEGYRK